MTLRWDGAGIAITIYKNYVRHDINYLGKMTEMTTMSDILKYLSIGLSGWHLICIWTSCLGNTLKPLAHTGSRMFKFKLLVVAFTLLVRRSVLCIPSTHSQRQLQVEFTASGKFVGLSIALQLTSWRLVQTVTLSTAHPIVSTLKYHVQKRISYVGRIWNCTTTSSSSTESSTVQVVRSPHSAGLQVVTVLSSSYIRMVQVTLSLNDILVWTSGS
jgi:hypothetical protein